MQSIFNQRASLVQSSKTKIINYFFETIFKLSLFVTIISLGLITVYIFANGLQTFKNVSLSDFFFGINWNPNSARQPSFGILPMILSSFYITFASLLLSAPIGIACAIFASELAGGTLKKFIQASVQILAGIPSVVYGLIGFSLIVPLIGDLANVTGYSILAAILILSVMILPTIISISQDAIQSVPNELKQASLALGATHFQTIYKIILPVAKPGIITAVVLGISRAFGEAMAVKMVIGSIQTMPNFSAEAWFGLLSPARTLTTNIVSDIEYASDGSHRASLFMTGAVLFMVVMIVNYCAYLFRNHKKRKAK